MIRIAAVATLALGLCANALKGQPTLEVQDCWHPLTDAGDGEDLELVAADWDGDGASELAYGSPSYELVGTDGGRMGVYGKDGNLWELEDSILANSGNHLGFALAVGDFDGDGVEEFAYGAPSDGGGRVGVRQNCGPSCGELQGIMLRQGESSIAGSSEDGDSFGWVLAAGDFDSDGYDDLAVGVPSETWTDGDNLHQGAVHVFYGSANGLDGARDLLFGQDEFTGQTREHGDNFGYVLAAGDLDFDGHDDLAIGVPWEDEGSDANSGVVHVVFGGDDGLDFERQQTWSQSSADVSGAPEPNDKFGWALAIADLDGVEISPLHSPDLVIGVVCEADGELACAGAVHVLYSGPDGPVGEGSSLLWRPGGSLAGANFGGRLLGADLDGDTADDLVVAATGIADESETYEASGEVYLYFGRDGEPLAFSGRAPWKARTGACGEGAGAAAGLQFGGTFAAGNFDEDGAVDLAIGIPGWSDSAEVFHKGAAQILFGSLFADGFDTGDTNRWTVLAPPGNP